MIGEAGGGSLNESGAPGSRCRHREPRSTASSAAQRYLAEIAEAGRGVNEHASIEQAESAVHAQHACTKR
ncbi:MAG: hypothetical protein U5K38_00585 [Woeseiaceae bacterium]|nr:hypothetical protein [Woeseiaceae bacterium]